jgi:hypothetical protein
MSAAGIVGLVAKPRALPQCGQPLPCASMMCPILGLEEDYKRARASTARSFCALAGAVALL